MRDGRSSSRKLADGVAGAPSCGSRPSLRGQKGGVGRANYGAHKEAGSRYKKRRNPHKRKEKKEM